MKTLKKLLKLLLFLVAALFVIFAGLIGFAVISDFKPPEKESLTVAGTTGTLDDSVTINLMTWNIGYCGLDRDMDFFYDGGTKVMTPRAECYKNLSAVVDFLKGNDSIDFFLLQEVDAKSKRSYRLDENDTIARHLEDYSDIFAVNYDVFFVPVPVTSPMGKVLSGITTLSRIAPSSSVRYSFPGEYGFPKQLFMLDRCFLVNRYPLTNGKEMVLINTHNEAFDPGEIRRAQMEYLKIFLIEEYNKGNYIIAGGDWNQCPPDFKPQFRENLVNTSQMVIPSDYLPTEWKWAYDSSIPSNRSVVAAYDPATTTTTVIDYFLVSPDIEISAVKGVNLNFRNSDHNPVIITVKLGPAGVK